MAATYSILELLSFTGHLNGLGPSGLGWDPLPLPFNTNKRPSRNARTVVGYHPVGIYPATLLSLPDTSATAMAFTSEQAMYKVFRSGVRERELGVIPTGWRGASARFSFSCNCHFPCRSLPRMKTKLLFAQATARRLRVSQTISVGCSPTGIRDTSFPLASAYCT